MDNLDQKTPHTAKPGLVRLGRMLEVKRGLNALGVKRDPLSITATFSVFAIFLPIEGESYGCRYILF